MKIEERLRESLQHRAEVVEPAHDGWASITRRIERRRRRTRTLSMSLLAGMSFAAVALAVVVATTVRQEPDQNVATGGGDPNRPATSAPYAVPPITATPGEPGAGQGTDGNPGSTTVPAPGGPPPESGTMRNYTPEAVWPETLAELEKHQEAADAGQQPWRNDPMAVVVAYLGDRGIPAPGVGEPSADANPSVRYAFPSMVGGRVYLSRLLDGSIYYVTRSESDDISEVHAVRQGDQLAVDLTVRVPGNLVVRTKGPGSDWNDSARRTVVAEQELSLTVDGPASTALIVQVRLETDDGTVALAESYLGQSVLGFDDEALHNGSILRFGGLGPVGLDMTLAEAERVAGVGTVTNTYAACTSLGTMGRPGGVSFLALNDSGRVDVVVVSDVGVRTAAGIGYGSTLAEVRDAYPDAEERITDGRGRVVLRPSGSDPAGYEIVVGVSDDKVSFIWSGRQGLSMADELCA